MKHERGVWQRRFWEHVIRDQRDFDAHLDSIHYNPVKQGWVRRAVDWPHSSFHRFVRMGLYPFDWHLRSSAEPLPKAQRHLRADPGFAIEYPG